MHSGPVLSAAFDTTTVLTGGTGGRVVAFNMATAEQLIVMDARDRSLGTLSVSASTIGEELAVTALDFDATSNVVVSGHASGMVALWNLESGAMMVVLDTMHTVRVKVVRLVEDLVYSAGPRLAVVCVCVCVCVWRMDAVGFYHW